MNIIKSSISRPVTIIMVFVCLLVLGIVSLRDIPLELYPDTNAPMASVTASYTGASPQDMEKLVTEPLEEQIATLNGVESITSTSRKGNTQIRIEFSTSIDNEEAMTELQQKISQAARFLPSDVDTPTVSKFDINSTPVVTLAMTGKDLVTLESIATDITTEFQSIEGVASVEVEGGQNKEICVTVNPLLLDQYNLSLSDVSDAISSKNNSNTVGEVQQGKEEIQLIVDGEYESIEAIGQTVISLSDGQAIKVDDVAEIEEVLSDQQSLIRVNGEEAILLSISKQSGTNTVDIADSVIATLDEIKPDLEKGVNLFVLDDGAESIRAAVSSGFESLILGSIIAVLVLLLFLRSVRSMIVVGCSLPISIIITFIFVNYSGQTLNVLTIAGLSLGIGMMLDSSIVIIENIMKYRKQGLGIKEAVMQGGSEVAGAVIASNTTSVVTFIPLVIIDNGMISMTFLPVALMIIFSQIPSLLVAITLVPMLSSKFLGNTKEMERIVNDPKWLQWITRFYLKTLSLSLKVRWVFVSVVAVLTIFSLSLFMKMGVDTFPKTDQGEVKLSSSFEESLPLSEIESYADKAEKIVSNYQDEIETQKTVISSSSVSITLTLKDTEKSSELSTALQQDLKSIAGADFSARRSFASPGGSESGVEITFSGSEQDVVQALLEQVELLLEQMPSIEGIEVPSLNGEAQYSITVNDQIAAKYSLTQSQIMNQLNAVFSGVTATTYRENGEEYDVTVELPEQYSSSIANLEGFLLEGNSGETVALGDVATIERTLGPVSISRVDQKNEYSITADIKEGYNSMTINNEITAMLKQIPVPNGYSIEMGGARMEFNNSLDNLLITIALAIFLVYTVMAIQFESFTYPFIIMFSIPPTVIGVSLGLLVTNSTLSYSSFIGMIILVGIVVSNAIVLIEYIGQLRERGLDRREAIMEGARGRLRPILITTVTTVLGMLPVALGFGETTATEQPIAVVVGFGLTVSTIFTLILIPIVYTIVDDFNHWFRRFFTKSKAKDATEDVPTFPG